MSVMQMLGRIALTHAGGDEVEGLLRQPKRLALLAYLASPTPGTWHRRDTLLALFWPELDEARARTALRNALYVLRRHLADGTIRTRGDDDVSLDPAMFASDVADFERAAAARWEEALEGYQGEMLPGLFVQEAEGFEKWLDGERRRLRRVAHRSALSAASAREAAGDRAGATAAIARAVELDPDDEASARRLMALHDAAGDRGQALATFERLVRHHDEAFGSAPSPETLALAEAIRQRRVADPAVTAPPFMATSSSELASPSGGDAALGAPALGARWGGSSPATSPVAALVAPPHRWRRAMLAMGSVALAAAAMRMTRFGHAEAAPHHVMIAPIRNTAGAQVDYVAAGIASELTRRLGTIGGLRLATSSQLRAPRWSDSAVVGFGRDFGAEVLVDLTLERAGDSLSVLAVAVDVASGRRREAARLGFNEKGTAQAASKVAASIAGTILRVPLPAIPGGRPPTDNPESYRLTVLGWRAQLGESAAAAQKLFQQAIAADPLNARAYAGLSSAFSAMTVGGQLPWDEGSRRAIAAAEQALALDSTQGSAWGTLGIMRALGGSGVAESEALIWKGIRMEPANAEVRMVLEILHRHTWEWDKALDAIRVARALDPLEARYLGNEVSIELCAGRAAEALAVAQQGLRGDPGNTAFHRMESRALARLGRWDEALASWRAGVRPADTSMVAALAAARGEAGYWQVDSVDATRRLQRLLETARGGSWLQEWRLAEARVAAGERDEGFALLQRLYVEGEAMGRKLPCAPQFDRVRNDPRYLALLERVKLGGMR